jgi:AmpD protein
MNQLDKNAHPFFQEIHNVKVSSHVLIRRSGELVQYVSFDKRAWHAGVSEFQGVSNCNDFSIGIELEGFENINYEEDQYQQLSILTRTLMSTYPAINKNRIVGHCDIAPQRKKDPYATFDWKKYFHLLDSH